MLLVPETSVSCLNIPLVCTCICHAHFWMQIPSSLQNIYKEIHQDLGCSIPPHGHLDAWVRQGVLLLNTALTVEVRIHAQSLQVSIKCR